MWNVKNVSQPPNLTYRCSNVDVETLKRACLRALAVLKEEKQLHSEAALLSRFLYSMKTKFRSDKGFNILGKVNRSLLQYLSLNLLATYNNFCECVPDPSDPDKYVPSCQMLQFLLLRTQSFARLWCYIVSNCQEAAQLFQARMGLGHNWWAAVVALAITSRIWAYGKYFITSACEWFSQLKPFLEILKVNGPPWLPNNYTFPDDLRQWLEETIPEKDILSEKCSLRPATTVTGFSKLLAVVSGRNDGDDDSDNVEIIDDYVNEDTTQSVTAIGKQTPSSENVTKNNPKEEVISVLEDIGEYVTRESMELPPSNTSSIKSLSENGICVSESISGGSTPTTKHLQYGLTENAASKVKTMSKGTSYSNELPTELINVKNKQLLNLASDMSPPAVPKENKHSSTKKLQSSTAISSTVGIGSNQISQLKSWSDLIVFMEREEQMRQKCKKSCITRKLDMLQWNMLKNVISSYVVKLKKKSYVHNEEKSSLVMKKLRKEIKVRLQ